MPTIKIEYNESDLKKLILDDLADKMPGQTFKVADLSIKVISSENYRAKVWETGRFKCEVNSF